MPTFLGCFFLAGLACYLILFLSFLFEKCASVWLRCHDIRGESGRVCVKLGAVGSRRLPLLVKDNAVLVLISASIPCRGIEVLVVFLVVVVVGKLPRGVSSVN